MKKSLCILGLIGLGSVIYGLFQPVFDYSFGWETLPNEVFETNFEGIEHEKYLSEITRSKHITDSIHHSSKSPSISVAAMINGRIVWTYAVGFQSLTRMIPADTNTQYRIGSTSKALTSLGLGKLIQEGKVNPDSSIQFYTGRFDSKPNISIRQLASHQSGIRNYGVCFCFPIWEYYRNKQFESIEESVLEFESDELQFKSGTNFAYSSFNFTALSLAMENVSSEGFLRYMQGEVFQPLHMNKTSPDYKDLRSPTKAVPYEVQGRMYRESFAVNLSNKWAGGGFMSTPSDLVRAGSALFNNSFLNLQTIELITSPQRLSDGSINEQNYALGWRHGFSKRYFKGLQEVEVIHHGGMALGGQALLVVYPEYKLVIALTMNKGDEEGNFQLFDFVTPIGELFISKLIDK
ncbi:serine hydrolase domain-containing protein [Ekhidna sp. To15]|uniref:serine hydrolase domain-containing protein n=1 Tax=Ekhidna sp. To15 TaxID=3395267 RepID=UPI003F521B13